MKQKGAASLNSLGPFEASLRDAPQGEVLRCRSFAAIGSHFWTGSPVRST
jgi:hypothetical protein